MAYPAAPASRLPLRGRTIILVLSMVLGLLGAGPLSAGGVVAQEQVASDSFTRTVSSGWGSAPTGGPYTHVGSASFSVASGRGQVNLARAGQFRRADLGGVNVLDADATVSIALPALPTAGKGTYTSLLLRGAGAGHYRGVVRIAPGGNAFLSLVRADVTTGQDVVLGGEVGLPRVSAGQWLNVRLEVTGTQSVTARAKAWVAGRTEPGWMVSATDSAAARVQGPGTVGMTFYSSGSSGSSRVLVDDLVVRSNQAAPPPEPPTGVVGTSGALPPGQASYPIPSGAVFVSPAGSDSNAGTQTAPLRTVEAALARVSSGGTIVMRAGTYNQRFSIYKKVTIQNYPGEAVWFDGSQVVSGWVAVNGGWRKDGWTYEFDSSPTYVWGAPDNPEDNWGFVNPDYPMAAHPDQVWIDGVSQRQVRYLSQLQPGSFYVDDQANRLYLGSSPVGKEVRASTLARAIEVRASGVTLRGVGIRRYAPSVPHMGTITLEHPQATLENVHITDNATTGLSVIASDAQLRRVTIARNGMLGMHGSYADRAALSDLLAANNNTENFNYAPAASGVKIGRTRGLTIVNASFLDNNATGLWLDESVYDAKIIRSVSRNNVRHGLSLEISAVMTVLGNVIADNGGFGIKINNTNQVQLWNNTLSNNDRPLNIVQDDRRGDQRGTPGHNPRRPFPDPTMPWRVLDVSLHNNIVSGTTGNCLLCVEDYSREHTAEQMRITANGNVYQRDRTNAPTWTTIWSRGASNPLVFTTVPAFANTTGQERAHLALNGQEALTGDLKPTLPVRTAVPTVARPLPSSLAALLGVAAGVKHLGALH